MSTIDGKRTSSDKKVKGKYMGDSMKMMNSFMEFMNVRITPH